MTQLRFSRKPPLHFKREDFILVRAILRDRCMDDLEDKINTPSEELELLEKTEKILGYIEKARMRAQANFAGVRS